MFELFFDEERFYISLSENRNYDLLNNLPHSEASKKN
jgi:hypothetical protein